MGSQSRRQRTVDRKRTDQLGQSSRPIAQANEDRLRLWRQRYAERKAASSSQHVPSGSQRGIRLKVMEMVDKLKSLSGESVDPEAPESCYSHVGYDPDKVLRVLYADP
ncbi:hypothetical protein R1sor_009231 [Riccia sorocarpa]|uniref:Uncharacterized protein n=1 Tax=Riccia sorocarpa TaxID=122646 RepID=A0ABD3H554_9MARC